MRFTNPGRKRNRLVIVMLLPAMVLLWLVGWSLYWIGHQKEGKPKAKPQRKREDNVKLVATAAFEEDAQEIHG